MASCGCYDNSDVIATLIITHFHLYLIQLWWQFFQMFVYGVVAYAQKKLHRYWPWKTVSSHFHVLVRPMLLHRMALVSVRRFCKNLGNLQEFFGQTVYRPPWQKIARTPMCFSMTHWGEKEPVRVPKLPLSLKRKAPKLHSNLVRDWTYVWKAFEIPPV